VPEDIRDTVENRRIVSAIMQTIVDSEPDADPEDEEHVIVIRLDALETILLNHVCGEWHKPWEQYTEKEKNEARGYV
jgi:hypothetical protein